MNNICLTDEQQQQPCLHWLGLTSLCLDVWNLSQFTMNLMEMEKGMTVFQKLTNKSKTVGGWKEAVQCSLSHTGFPVSIALDGAPCYVPIPKNSNDINQCVNNSWSYGTQTQFCDTSGLITMSQTGSEEGSAAAQSTARILHMMPQGWTAVRESCSWCNPTGDK